MAGPGCRLHPNVGPGREPAEGAAWRTAHTEARALTAQVVGPLVQHALHGARGPHAAPARRGDTGPASHPGPGGGVTATAEEHQLRGRGLRLRLRLARSVAVDEAERPPERGEGGAAPEAAVAGRRLSAATELTAPAPARSRMLIAPRARARARSPKSAPGVWPRRRGAGGRGAEADVGSGSSPRFESPGVQL